jgi:hypothetical protein
MPERRDRHVNKYGKCAICLRVIHKISSKRKYFQKKSKPSNYHMNIDYIRCLLISKLLLLTLFTLFSLYLLVILFLSSVLYQEKVPHTQRHIRSSFLYTQRICYHKTWTSRVKELKGQLQKVINEAFPAPWFSDYPLPAQVSSAWK